MKRFFAAVAVSLSAVSFALAQSGEINIVPKPASVTTEPGFFELSKNTSLTVFKKSDRPFAEALIQRLRENYGFTLKITNSTNCRKSCILMSASATAPTILAEGYAVEVTNKGMGILARDPAGMYYALQSLYQLLPPRSGDGKVRLQNTIIRDQPRFKYRGMHLDVSRHFMPVEFVKKYIDLMSQFKFNTFHWHLTDDQGWRIEIKKYPKLTEIGSYRSESHEGPYSTTFKGDGRPVSGFYTQEQIKDVIAYAKARYITVIPEIELPGHASAALAAYPELGAGCAAPDYKFEVKKTWGIFKEVFCPTEETFKFLEEVLDETIKLFPESPYIHIGGDEVLKDFWKASPFVQELKRRENLKDEHEVQSYFIRRIEKFINSKGKKIIGWDEILEGGVAPNATIMSWRGMKGGIEAAKAKHDVIMTPTDFVYFDYGQGDPAYEPLNIGSYVPLAKVYSFEPVPPELTADEAKYILGGQANIWTEYIETGDKVEYMAFPRMLALSEVLWSKKEDRNFDDFKRRLNAILPRLDKQDVNYRIPEPFPVGAFLLGENEAYAFEVTPPVPGSKVFYTKDGSTPTESSTEAPSKLSVFPIGKEVVTVKAIVVLPGGRKSSVYAATFLRGSMREAVTLAETKPGVTFELGVPGEERRTGETRSIFVNQFEKQIDLKKPFSVQYEGYIKAPADGIYEMLLDSTWAASLMIGDTKLIDDAGEATRKMRSAIVPLKAGWHRISIRYSNQGGEPHFRFRWGIKGQGLRQAGGGEFVH